MIVSLSIWIQCAFVALILTAMIFLLFGINSLFSDNFKTKEEETKKFREEVSSKEDVITKENLFSRFLSTESLKKQAASSNKS